MVSGSLALLYFGGSRSAAPIEDVVLYDGKNFRPFVRLSVLSVSPLDLRVLRCLMVDLRDSLSHHGHLMVWYL